MLDNELIQESGRGGGGVSELPEGWDGVSLDDVAQWGSGGTPSRSNPDYYSGHIPWIKTGELGSGTINKAEEMISELALKNSSAKIYPKGSVVVAMYGATIGKTSILGIDAATNQACGVGIPIDGVTTSNYLYYYLQSQKDAFIEAGKGGAQPNISQGVIKNWPLPLAPLNEQKRIADKLDSLLKRVDSCRERLDRVPLILKRFRQSVLAAATSGALTEDWREKNRGEVGANGVRPGVVNGDDAEEGACHAPLQGREEVEGWAAVRLANVAHSRLGKMLDKSKNQGTPVSYLRNVNVRWFDFDLSDILTIKVSVKEKGGGKDRDHRRQHPPRTPQGHETGTGVFSIRPDHRNWNN